jgi:stage II sporulation protein E
MDREETHNGVRALFTAVRENSLASVKDAPENFVRRCPHIKELVAISNCLYNMYCRCSYWNLQREQSRRLLSHQLNGVADVMEKIAREVMDYGDERELLERELQKAIAKRGMPADNAGIISIGEKSINIWAQYLECPGELYCRRAMEEEVSRLLGYEFCVHEHACGGHNCVERCEYRLLARGAYGLLVGKAQLAKDGKGVCGDSGSALLLEEGKQLLMISDGMGVGDRAAAESSAAINVVSRLLEAGLAQDTAIDTVNAALSLRGSEESFVTLDMCVVDLYSGSADFVKTGGAASFIKRGGLVRMVRGGSLPVGVLYTVDKEVLTEQLLPGDMIVMASDGLLDVDSKNDNQWLVRILEQASAPTAQTMAEYLLDKVVSVSNGKLKDDITVLVAQLAETA